MLARDWSELGPSCPIVRRDAPAGLGHAVEGRDDERRLASPRKRP